ncbi:LamG-like jellyroll fold domain-containing protein [Runella sp.]|uniref:LamG-like jellyroll fold domain-containing protein n=1 Tax=Runella sp. TaxID=1960881 RepID=UPI003018635D
MKNNFSVFLLNSGVFLLLNVLHSQNLDNSFMAGWSFEETTELVSYTKGELVNATLVREGKTGQGLGVTSLDGYFNTNKGVDLYVNFSVCFWFKPQTENISGVLFQQQNVGNGRVFKLSINKNALAFECKDEFGIKNYVNALAYPLKKGTFHFIALTLKNEQLTIYCDMKEVLSINAIALNIREPQTSDQLCFGSMDKKQKSAQGILDDIYFFKRALTLDELNKVKQGWRPTLPEKDPLPPPTPPSIKGRASVIKGDPLTVKVDSVTIEYFDRDKVDNDTISVYLNGVLVVEKQCVSKVKKRVTAHLDRKKDNYLSVFAENVGDVPPNTATIQIYAGTERYNVDINSDYEENGTIIIKFKKE